MRSPSSYLSPPSGKSVSEQRTLILPFLVNLLAFDKRLRKTCWNLFKSVLTHFGMFLSIFKVISFFLNSAFANSIWITSLIALLKLNSVMFTLKCCFRISARSSKSFTWRKSIFEEVCTTFSIKSTSGYMIFCDWITCFMVLTIAFRGAFISCETLAYSELSRSMRSRTLLYFSEAVMSVIVIRWLFLPR